jgi:GH25 family lysozyme M1 (1,4-beta-N-acetylmuramidase)
MNFIDISNWQNGIDLAELFKRNALDGVIVKATENTGYTNPNFKTWAAWLTEHDKPWGVYHFCAGADANAEAKHFYATVRHYIGKCVPFADYEADVLQKGTTWLKTFLDEFYALSGVQPLIYCSQSVTQEQNFSAIAREGHKLWVAQYADFQPVYGFLDKPWHNGSVAPFNGYVMQQYTSCGVLDGWRAYLDFDKFYGTPDDWKALCGDGNTATTVTETPTPSKLKGPDAVVVSEVLSGRYGTAQEREANLKTAGYSYKKVQAKINELYSIASKCATYCKGQKAYLNSIIKIMRTMI